MYVKLVLGAGLVLACSFNVTAQLTRPSPPSTPVAPAVAASPITTTGTIPNVQSVKAPPTAQSGLVPASTEARESIAEQAARARADALKGPSEQVPAIVIRSNGSTPNTGGNTYASREIADPRLLSIVGQYGIERAEIAYDGLVYTVSRAGPRLGGTGWRVADIDSRNSSVRLEKGAPKDDAGKDTGKKTAHHAAAQTGLVLGFSRKDTEAGPAMESRAPVPFSIR